MDFPPRARYSLQEESDRDLGSEAADHELAAYFQEPTIFFLILV